MAEENERRSWSSEVADPSEQYQGNMGQLRDHVQLIRDALNHIGRLPRDLVLSYDLAYRRHVIQTVVDQLSKPIPQSILHAVLSANITILSGCAELTLDMVNLFNDTPGLTLKHLGMGYYAMGGNPARYVVIQILRVMAVKYRDLDVSDDDSNVLLDVLLDFAQGAREEGVDADKRRAEALITLRDLCGNYKDNQEAAVTKGAVAVVVEVIREDRYSMAASVGAAIVCEAALGALGCLLESPKGWAAFVYHNTSFHTLQNLIGTTSSAITHSAVTCLFTVFHRLPQDLQTRFKPVLDPQTRPDTPFYSVLAWDLLESMHLHLRDDDHQPTDLDENSVLALFNDHPRRPN